MKEEIRKILGKENFIIERHFECHKSDEHGDCPNCNREDTVNELLSLFNKKLSKVLKEFDIYIYQPDLELELKKLFNQNK